MEFPYNGWHGPYKGLYEKLESANSMEEKGDVLGAIVCRARAFYAYSRLRSAHPFRSLWNLWMAKYYARRAKSFETARTLGCTMDTHERQIIEEILVA